MPAEDARGLLRQALGDRAFEYMCRSLAHDPRLRSARMVDIVVRKDAVERRIEADWLKAIAKIVLPEQERSALAPVIPIDQCRAEESDDHAR